MSNLAGKEYFNVDEAAHFCCTPTAVFLQHADAQGLPFGDLWGRRMYRRSDVLAFLERNVVYSDADAELALKLEPARQVRRYRAMKSAMPTWADEVAIERVYAEARRLTREIGIHHSVDHIVPILGKNVCGLHVHYNLRVVTRSENSRKGNRFTS